MEDAWEELGDSYENSKSKLIGEIDCTAEEAEELCQQMNVKSYPTLKFGDVNDLQEYEGPRDYTSLKKFADKQLKPTCGPHHIQLCDKATRKEIRRLKKLSLEELDAEITAKMDAMTKLDEYEKEFVANLEEQYEKAMSEKDSKLKELKEGNGGNLPLMKSVAANRGIEVTKTPKKKVDDDDDNGMGDEL